MIFLELFLSFFKVGLFCFGGGYGMLPLMEETVVAKGWLTAEQFYDFVGVCESTPGPIAVNMATYVGSVTGGPLGSIVATLGTVLPAFIIILIISALLKNFLKYSGVKAFLSGVRPCVVSLILGTAATLFLSIFLGIGGGDFALNIDVFGIIIFIVVVAISLLYKQAKGKKPSPILMIAISACLGMIFYSI